MFVHRLKFLEGLPASCCNPLTCSSVCLHCDCILFLFHFVVAERTCIGAGISWLGWPLDAKLMTHPFLSCYNAYWLGVGVVPRRIALLCIPGSSPAAPSHSHTELRGVALRQPWVQVQGSVTWELRRPSPTLAKPLLDA